MNRVPRLTTNVDRKQAERPITNPAPVDSSGAHPDVNRIRQQRANRAGHVCRECRNPDCVGVQRDGHELAFARAESSALLSGAAYFECPHCHKDTRYAPACRPAVA